MVTFIQIPFRKLKRILIPSFVIIVIIIVYLNIPSVNNEIEIVIPIKYITTTTTKTVSQTTTIKKFDFETYINESKSQLNYNVHIFYYAWYGNLEVDKKWIHWDHKRLAHWNKGLIQEFSLDRHNPPDDIGADFYPALGLYSSRDKKLIEKHMKMIKYTGIGVIILSWLNENRSDPNGEPVNDLVNNILDIAEQFELKVALHVEPYDGRSAISVKEDLLYIYKNYANHSAYFRKPRFKTDKPLPVIFIYDSYLISGNDWLQIFGKKGSQIIRNKPYDFFVVGLLLDRDSCNDLANQGFDAGYTYFAGEQVSYSSASNHWSELNRKCLLRNVEFYPSIGPGYKDSSVRPWNDFVTQTRNDGKYYLRRFSKVRKSGARSFGVTSFNEWHEGTQIEPAVPHSNPGNRLIYEDYLPKSPMFYLDLTKQLVHSYTTNRDINLPEDHE